MARVTPVHQCTTKRGTDKRRVVVIAAAFAAAAVALSNWQSPPRAKHTSILTGEQWVQELLVGHAGRFREQLGVSRTVFRKLCRDLQTDAGKHSLRDNKHVKVEEQVAIFLHFVRTGQSSSMLQERFQRSGDTISNYIHKVANALVSRGIYRQYVKPMTGPAPMVANDPKFRYFANSRGCIDGSHFRASVPAEDTPRYRNRKGFISQNVLAGTDHSARFIYCLSGWEGSAADSRIYDSARRRPGLALPRGCFYLGDAGFPLCDALMVPYRGKRYHLKEWSRGTQRPADREELFNLRHATLRNIVERTFGIFKRRFGVTNKAPEYPLKFQVKLIPALCALHNFILTHDPEDQAIGDWTADGVLYGGNTSGTNVDDDDDMQDVHHSIHGDISDEERKRAGEHRDALAQEMWDDYLEYIGRFED